MAVYLGISNNGIFVTSDGYTLQDSDGISLNALPMTSKLKFIFNGVTYHANINLPAKESE